MPGSLFEDERKGLLALTIGIIFTAVCNVSPSYCIGTDGEENIFSNREREREKREIGGGGGSERQYIGVLRKLCLRF
jgi:hypothetical protein